MSDNAAVEDSLAAAFDNSFSMPAPASQPASADKAASAGDTPKEGEGDGEGEGEGDSGPDWRPTYEANLAMWQEEASAAREKAEATRAAIETEHTAAAKSVADAEKAKKDSEKEAKNAADREARLAAALADESPSAGPIHKKVNVEDRTLKVKEAWELVKNKKDTAPPSAASVTASQWEELSAPHSSIEDISAQDTSASPSASAPSTKEKSGDSSASSPPAGSASLVPTAAASSGVPAPTGIPSLTLSLFTAPDKLTISRVFAALGINLLLPFINGIMLGLGEITAREGVRISRLWWKGERSVFGIWRNKEGTGSSGNVTSVGLSGSAGF